MSIRLAQTHDAEAISRLSEQMDYSITPETCAEHIAYMSHHPDVYQLLVLEKDMEVVGYMQLTVVRHIQTQSYVEISALVVDERFRSLGIGSKLIQTAKAWAQEVGYERLVVRTNENRERAIRFYSRGGFRELKKQTTFQINF
ncbi:GNAT family N-acetyltransferase [Gynuella sp.]|uniref:GNAT family N-acetyltransferase n=1 Tax=Gynuella sp. TaxID=2969146 RepID=UPI003D10A7F6